MARTEIVPPFDIAQFPSPLAGFRKYTEPNDAKLYDTELLRVTGAPAGTPLRFATLDYYDGSVWGAGSRAGIDSASPGTAFQQVGEKVSARGDGKRATLQVTIPEGGYSDVWLPTVGQVTGVKFAGARADELASRLWLNIDTSTAIVPDRVSAGRPLHDGRAAPHEGGARQAAGLAGHRERQPRAESRSSASSTSGPTPGARTRRARGTSCAPRPQP